jgi:hypothetical protein
MVTVCMIWLSAVAIADANDGMGVSSWASWNPKQVKSDGIQSTIETIEMHPDSSADAHSTRGN